MILLVSQTSVFPRLQGTKPEDEHMIRLEFILFSMMVGVWSAADSPDIQQWFIIRAVNICRLHDIRNYHDLQEHMVTFLLSKSLQDASIRKVATVLEQG